MNAMRGLLISPISQDFAENQGILNKLRYQHTAFERLGVDISSFCNSRLGPMRNGARVADYALVGRVFNSINHYAGFFRHVYNHGDIANMDFVYVRYPLSLPPFLVFLRAIKKRNPSCPIVVEVPTYPYRAEMKTPKQRLLLALDDLGASQLKDYVDLIVTFYGQKELFGVPCISFGNGVDPSALPVTPVRPDDGRLSVISVGNLARWHGIDRFLEGMAPLPNGGPVVHLHVVGAGPELSNLQSQTQVLGLADRVTFHGMHTGESLDALFADADLALGGLAVHRLGLPNSSSLKVREYCARAMPFVLAGDDPDFPNDWPYALQIEADDTPVDITRLNDFVRQLRRDHPGFSRDMRTHAVEHLSWESKLQRVVNWVANGAAQS